MVCGVCHSGMSRLTVRLLGGFEAASDGAVLAIPTRKAQALLAYLACTPGDTHPRDKLAALLWAEASPTAARSALRQTLFVLRKALGSVADAVLILTADALALRRGSVQTDIVSFERAVAAGTPAELEMAAAVYRGDLLVGLSADAPGFEEWLMTERERLRELAIEGLARLLTHQRAVGATESAVQVALRLLSLDPLQESVHRTLMRLYAQLGRRDTALRQYQQCVEVLRLELDVEPEAETKELYQQVLRQRPAHAATTAVAVGDSETPLIGRGTETTRLQQALAGALRGEGQVLAIVGEPGIGKTRMLAELAAEAGRRGGRVLLGRAYETERALPFGPWASALRDAGILKDAGGLEALAGTWVTELARLFPELADERRPQPVGPPDLLHLFEALAELLRQLALAQPVIIVLDDCHWADEATLRFLAFFARRLRSAPIMLAMSARDEEIADTPLLRVTLEELAAEQRLTWLTLNRLGREDTLMLVQWLGRGSDGAASVVQREQVWEASAGNPFIVIETMRAISNGVAVDPSRSLPLPARVKDTIARRLDRLSDRARQLARVASVIGREFEFPLLQHVAGTSERETAEAMEELVRRRVVHGVGDRFDFTHDRIREVVAGELLLPRAPLHARIVEAIELLHRDRFGGEIERLAYHAVRGGLRDKAVRYLRQAGLKAVSVSALHEARLWFDQGLGVLEGLPETRFTLEEGFEIRLALRTPLIHLGEVRRAVERLREAEVLADKLEDGRRRVSVHAVLAITLSLLDEGEEALASGNRGRDMTSEVGDADLRITATTGLEIVHYFRGEYERVVELATENLAAIPAERAHEYFGHPAPASVYNRYWMVLCLPYLGRFPEAAMHEAAAFSFAQAMNHTYALGIVHLGASTIHLWKGDWASARARAEKGIAVFRAGHIAFLLPRMVASAAWALAQLGESREALNRVDEGEQLLDDLAARGLRGICGWVSLALGRACFALGRLDAAKSFAMRYQSTYAAEAHPGEALHLLGQIASHPDDVDTKQARFYYERALALAAPRGMRPLAAHCHFSLGKLCQRAGNRVEAQEHLTVATTMYRDMDMAFWLEEAKAEM